MTALARPASTSGSRASARTSSPRSSTSAAFLRRLRTDDPTRPIGDALLDQRIIAGIGNLWKAEGCFEARDRPVAAHRRRQRRRGAGDRPRHAPADAGVRARRDAGALQGRLRHRRASRARAAARPRTSAHAGRATTTGRHTGAHDVSDEADRPQGSGPDRPRQHARVVRRRAGPRRRHDRVRRAARAPARARRPAGCCSRTTTSTSTARRRSRRASPTSRRARSTASSSTSTSSSPATRSA